MAKKRKTDVQNTAESGSAGMNVPGSKKALYYNILAVLSIWVLLVAFYLPVLSPDNTLLPPDTVASKSFQPYVQEAFDSGVYPLWNPYIFSGMPSFASLSRAPYMDITGDVINGIVWFLRLIFPLSAFTRLALNYLLLGGLLYFLLRKKDLDILPALFSSIALLFVPAIVAYAAFGHTTKLATAALIPIVFFLTERLLKEKNLLYFCLTAMAIGFQLLRFHVQINFYSLFLAGVYFVYWAVLSVKDKEKAWPIIKGGLLLAGAVCAGIVVSSVVNLGVWEYSHYSIRGGETGLQYGYATNWSFPPAEILTFLNPSFMGFGKDTYWGAMPFTDFPMYFGSIVLMLAGLSMIVKRNRTTVFFMIVAGLALFISFGKHFPVIYGPMFKLMPFFNKFRAPKMIHVLLQLSMAILAGFGLHGIMEMRNSNDKAAARAVKRYLLIFTGIILLLFVVLVAAKSAYMGWADKARGSAEKAYSLAASDGLRGLILIGLAAFLILRTIQNKLHKLVLPLALTVLVVGDFWIINSRFVNPQPAVDESNYFQDQGEVAFLKEQPGYFRILPVGDGRSPNWYMFHLLESAYGYQGAKLKLYQELMDTFRMPQQYLSKYLKRTAGGMAWRSGDELPAELVHAHRTFLQLTNVKYIVTPYGIPDADLRLVYRPRQRGGRAVLEFTKALPRVYFPEKVVPVLGDEAARSYMASMDFDAATTAVVTERTPFQIVHSDSNRAEITERSIHTLRVDAHVHTPSLLAVSEVFYPAGWHVEVDGQPADIERVNYAFRGVYLKPGEHTLVFRFSPDSFNTGLRTSIIALVLLTAGAVISGVRMRRKSV